MTLSVEHVIQVLAIIFGAGGIVGGIVSLVRAPSQNRAENATAQSSLSAAWDLLSKQLQERIETLEGQVKVMQTQLDDQGGLIDDLKDWAERLVKQIKCLNPEVEPEKFIRRKVRT